LNQYSEIVAEIKLDHSRVVMRRDGILELHTNDEHEYEIKDVKENVEAFGRLSGGKKAPVLIIGGAFTSVSKEARVYMASEESLKYSLCEAFLLNSLPQKLLISFYIKANKPLVPSRAFSSHDKAVEWLKDNL
jgi:glutamine synthetase type III